MLINGTAGKDLLNGTNLSDAMFGHGGEDVLNGLGGNDALLGGNDKDQLLGGAGNDRLYFEGLADVYDGGTGIDTLDLYFMGNIGTGLISLSGDPDIVGIENITGGGGGDSLRGSAGANVISGGIGEDYIEGMAGSDKLDGGAGIWDLLKYGLSNAGVTVDLASGKASGGHATGDTLVGFEHVWGSGFADTIRDEGNFNIIAGAGGNDVIDARGGNDDIRGNSGTDTLTGGTGKDTFIFDPSDTGGPDRVTDFTAEDFIQLEASPGPEADFIGTAAFSGANQVRAFQQGGNTTVEFNEDADLTAEVTVLLDGLHALTINDFVFYS